MHSRWSAVRRPVTPYRHSADNTDSHPYNIEQNGWELGASDYQTINFMDGSNPAHCHS
jgi:hypothetical protein